MNFASVEKIAAAILYEGYILYPYRSSAIKNRQRWNFGTLYPRVYAEAQRPVESFRFQAEFLCVPGPDAIVDFKLSFLQLLRPESAAQAAVHDPSLQWDEAVERAFERSQLRLSDLLQSPHVLPFRLAGTKSEDAIASPTPEIEVVLTITAESITHGAAKLRVQVQNTSALSGGASARRDKALPQSLVSAHLLVGIVGGEFVSLLEPPDELAAAAKACVNTGVFPVLAGEEPDRSVFFCSPIILYDYPKIAPESEGDFFDGTEMDEMLTLRVLTLTDAEKEEVRRGDPRARRILERTEALIADDMLKAHGIVRQRNAVPAEFSRSASQTGQPLDGMVEPWDPFAEEEAPPAMVRVFGIDLRVGDRVRICPQRSADIMDLALAGKIAMIEAIEQDFDDRIQLALVLDDDPGREFGMMRQPGHRFFFGLEEVEPYTEQTPA